MSWFSKGFGGGNASSSSSTGNAFSGTGGSRWINMDTQQIKNFGGELTGENDAFSKSFGIELTRQQRLIGFAALLYAVGVLVSLTGTGFLLGFIKQFRQMFKPVRITFTLVMILAFIMVVAFLLYSLSYIPWCIDFLKRMFNKLF
uniref:Sft2-domain-containing protein n=1 Tax=Melanopsichium pennsylvanicum 4 TaxID=1398559 RepID=A0A077R1I5_9BASI|nr:sft2-domain-containing protein [Melanopsichium pennsylvanicum 4]